MNCGELVKGYLEWKSSANGNEHTLRSYRKDLAKLLDAIGSDTPIEEFDLFALHGFMSKLGSAGLSPISARHVLACIRDLVKWACQEGVYKENFVSAFKFPRTPKTFPLAPTQEEVKILLDGGWPTAWPERDKVILELLYCNLRVGELVMLNLEDQVASDEVIVQGKGRKERKVPLTPTAVNAITVYLASREMVLKMRRTQTDALLINLITGERITTRSVGRIVRSIAVAKGLQSKVTPHRLRAAYVTHMLDRGAELTKISQLVGHAKSSTTMDYCGGVNWKRMKDAYDRTFQR
jgi:integrase/recombinase XerC